MDFLLMVEEEDVHSFGRRLKQERIRLGLSQRELAKIGGVEPNAQFHYESGTRSPKADYLQNLVRAGVDLSYLFTNDSDTYPSEPASTNSGRFLTTNMRSDEAVVLLITQCGHNIETVVQTIHDVARYWSINLSSCEAKEFELQMLELKASATRLIDTALRLSTTHSL
ncbi:MULTISPECIES: helix-turn-helix transcriptional regulator [unclassified Pseudomonas]|uniref:helix-turn-helix domain-containing protein n=1 Tax=unclassified Pseudomonas TaxID=196821 RepID=UPI00211448F7|nr:MULTISPECIES: helix-turn-helix transcriptional regulator [unclassified Pseudomonas]